MPFRPPDAFMFGEQITGEWRVVILDRRSGNPPMDITFFRGAPIGIQSVSSTDPFGPAEASLSVATISALEALGHPGTDTWWVRDGVNVDIHFRITDPVAAAALQPFGLHEYIWEGYLQSVETSLDRPGVTLGCSGAMRALDGRQAQQRLLAAPHPFERVIEALFADAASTHPTGLLPLDVRFPDWWTKQYAIDPLLPTYLKPVMITEGQYWSGMTTREMGRWDPLLTSAVQGLLSVMFTERGQFTIMLERGRKPVMKHRDRVLSAGVGCLVLDAVQPGLSGTLSIDGSQTVQAIYGVSRATISGTAYNGARYDVNGNSMGFDPFAQLAMVDKSSGFADGSAIRRELYINFNDGLAPAEAMDKAREHLMVNGTPGVTGSITLQGVDPMILVPPGLTAMPFPAQCIQAGMTLQLRGYGGKPEGVLLTVAGVQQSPDDRSVTMDVDSKFRDYMTVREVQERGRDALRPWHMMTVGKYNVNIPDAVLQWDYTQGSGYIPYESLRFWQTVDKSGANAQMPFPWEEWTTAHPPSSAEWEQCYIKIPGIQIDENGYGDAYSSWNRSGIATGTGQLTSREMVLLSAAGEISLLQFAAYHADGRVKQVPFHLSLWLSNIVGAYSTPKLLFSTSDTHYLSRFTDADIDNVQSVQEVKYPNITSRAQPYPFFPNAWEKYNESGTQANPGDPQIPMDGGLLIGYGNHYEKAGYWPHHTRYDVETGGESSGENVVIAQPTGLLQDSSGFSWTMPDEGLSGVNPYEGATLTLAANANCTVLVFCESYTDTYFLGRMFRKEYGG